MTRTTLQYLMIFLKSRSIDFFPNSSCHFFDAFVNAFFLLLYLICNSLNLLCCLWKNKEGQPHSLEETVTSSTSEQFALKNACS